MPSIALLLLLLMPGCGTQRARSLPAQCVERAAQAQSDVEGRPEAVERLARSYMQAAEIIIGPDEPFCPECEGPSIIEAGSLADQVLQVLSSSIPAAIEAGIDFRPLLTAVSSLALELGRTDSFVLADDTERQAHVAHSVLRAGETSVEALESALHAALDLHGRGRDSRALQIRCLASQARSYVTWITLVRSLVEQITMQEIEASQLGAQAQIEVDAETAEAMELEEEDIRRWLEVLTQLVGVAEGFSNELRSLSARPDSMVRELAGMGGTSDDYWQVAKSSLEQTRDICQGEQP